MSDEEDLTRCIATLNLDHTTRAKEISTQKTLCTGVVSTLSKFKEPPGVVSMVEVSGKTWVKLFEAQTDYAGVQTPNGYTRGGSNYIAYDTKLYDCKLSIESRLGRYCGIIYEDKDKSVPKRYMHLAVHLPTKGDWRKQALKAAQTIEWARLKENVDEVTVAGDFNKKPEEVVEIFSEMGMQASLLSEDGVPTTAKGNCIDNVLFDSSVSVRTVRIQRRNALFSHHPMSAVALYE